MAKPEGKQGRLTRATLARAVAQGSIETVIVGFTDPYGRMMGKRYDATFFLEDTLAHGSHACDYLLTVDMEMTPVQGYRFANWERGYGDVHLVPDLGTLRIASWLDKCALVLCDVAQEKTDAPVAVAPRTILRAQIDVRAPFDGLVTERLTDPGNLAAPGVPLLRIESGGARQVVVRVDEARAAYVHTGDRVIVVVDAPAEPGADDTELQGIVTEVARAVGTDQRAFTVKVSLPPTVTARTGSFARVVFRGAPRRALLVPAHAIQRHGQVSSVYVVQDDVATLRLIRVGTSSSEGVEVVAGLDAGESIVVSPLTRLVDGARVTVGSVPTRAGGTS